MTLSNELANTNLIPLFQKANDFLMAPRPVPQIARSGKLGLGEAHHGTMGLLPGRPPWAA